MSAQRNALVVVAPSPEALELLQGQAGYMQFHGLEVTVVSRTGPELEAFSRREGVRYHLLAGSGAPGPLADLVTFVALVRHLLKVRPDLIHAHGSPRGLLWMAAAWLAGVHARIYTMHPQSLEAAGGMRRALLRLSERVAVKLGSRVYAVSESLRAQAELLGLAPCGRVEVIGAGSVNGVDAETQFRPLPECSHESSRIRRAVGLPSEARVVGYLGRVGRSGGVDDLLTAWRSIRNEFPDLRLLLVGRADDQDPLSEESEQLLRMDPRICRLGEVRSRRGVYSAVDVVAIPGRFSGFPKIALEAAAMERPVVAAQVAGSVDAVRDGETGTLVRPRDPRALARALRGYLRNPELGKSHGKAARSRVLREFHPKQLSAQVYGVYREVLQGVRPCHRRPITGVGTSLRGVQSPESEDRGTKVYPENGATFLALPRGQGVPEDPPGGPGCSFFHVICALIHRRFRSSSFRWNGKRAGAEVLDASEKR